MKCAKCGAENPAENKFCSECGSPLNTGAQNLEKRKKGNRRMAVIAILSVIALILIIGIAASHGGNSDSNSNSSSRTSAVQANVKPSSSKSVTTASNDSNSWDSRFQISDLKLSKDTDDDGSIITGTLINKTGKQFSYIQVEINEYDASGAQVDSDIANLDNFDAHGTWKFKAYVTESSVKTVKIKDVTAF